MDVIDVGEGKCIFNVMQEEVAHDFISFLREGKAFLDGKVWLSNEAENF